eukprot:6007328-Amphidinium_carterae.1
MDAFASLSAHSSGLKTILHSERALDHGMHFRAWRLAYLSVPSSLDWVHNVQAKKEMLRTSAFFPVCVGVGVIYQSLPTFPVTSRRVATNPCFLIAGNRSEEPMRRKPTAPSTLNEPHMPMLRQVLMIKWGIHS